LVPHYHTVYCFKKVTFIQDGNPNKIEGRINFTKRELMFGQIRRIMEYQQIPFNLKPLEELGIILCNFPITSKDIEKQTWSRSREIEAKKEHT
jgi:hypothetical protein